MNRALLKIISVGSLLVPYAAFAQNPQAIEGIINRILDTFNNIIIPLLFVFATLIFLWGVIKYIAKGSEEKEQKAARSLMLYGIIGLAVMLAVWGIVNIIIQYFGVGGQGIPTDIPRQP
ncbi:MAG: hypothetical protein HYT37_03950 [Candidatus Sungbacteria bacterium]|nr:hypothetical protein [Candidatus Sungbacteria bacterium]